MKRLLRVAAWLYPRAWRDRYGEEFDALIDEMRPRWRDVVNTLIGALIMQISRLALVPIATAALGAVVGVAVSLALPPVYASSSWVLVQSADTSVERDQRIRSAIDAALQETAFDKKAITVKLHGEPELAPVLLEVSVSADSARAAQQATERAMGRIIEANFIAAQRGPVSSVQFRAVQPPNLPQTGKRDTARNSAVGGGLGFLAGAVFAFGSYRRRSTT
jgi:hypothetical protein